MDKIIVNGVEFTEKEIKAIEKEYNDLLHEVSHIKAACGDDRSYYNSNYIKVIDRYEKLLKLVYEFRKEENSRQEIFKEQLEMKIDEATK